MKGYYLFTYLILLPVDTLVGTIIGDHLNLGPLNNKTGIDRDLQDVVDDIITSLREDQSKDIKKLPADSILKPCGCNLMVLKGKRNFLFYAGLNDILGVAVGDRVKLVYKTKRPSCTAMKKRCVEHCEEIGKQYLYAGYQSKLKGGQSVGNYVCKRLAKSRVKSEIQVRLQSISDCGRPATKGYEGLYPIEKRLCCYTEDNHIVGRPCPPVVG